MILFAAGSVQGGQHRFKKEFAADGLCSELDCDFKQHIKFFFDCALEEQITIKIQQCECERLSGNILPDICMFTDLSQRQQLAQVSNARLIRHPLTRAGALKHSDQRFQRVG